MTPGTRRNASCTQLFLPFSLTAGQFSYRWALHYDRSSLVHTIPYGAHSAYRFHPRDAMLARVIAIATCPSVRPSVTRRYCVKTKKASGMISSPSGSPETLVFWCQISSPNSKGFPPNGGLKQGSVGQIQRYSSFKRQYLENCSRYGQSYY